MKIRTQLVLACFLLSILPLAGIVLYSYQSSRDALEMAYQNEAARTTRQMDRRLAAIRTDLEQRLAELSVFPLQMPSGAPGGDAHVANDVMMALGDSAKLVDSLELRPMPAPVEPVPPEHGTAAASPPSPAPPPPAVAAGAAAARATAAATAAASRTAGAIVGMVIDIPAIPRFRPSGMSEEQQKRLHELGRLAGQLANGAATMSAEERSALEKQMEDLQKSFSSEMETSHAEIPERVDEALKARDALRKRHLTRLLASNELRMKLDKADNAPPAEPPGTDVVPTIAPSMPDNAMPVIIKGNLSPGDSARMHAHQKRVAAVFGRELTIPVRRHGAVVANLSAQIRLEEVIRRVLGSSSDEGEIAFAADRDGNLYTRSATDRKTLDSLGVSKALISGAPLPRRSDWIVSMSKDPQTGVRIGVMRPCGSDLGGFRRAAAVNFSTGIALIVVALIGIVPVANHITRDVKLVTAGAERIALGDLTTRVPMKSRNEFGQLAAAFNKMAADLSHHQQTIVEQERSRKEQELQQRMLEMEYSRKSVELEEARRFQLSMLPKELPRHDAFDIAVSTETATEVGGDYYDFHAAPDGTLSIAVGDATGHGAKAGTMITVAKTLFASYTADMSPAVFLGDAAEKIKRMDFTRMAMSLLLARFEPRRMTIAAAGMPPTLVHRAASGRIDEIVFESTPLGTLGSDYAERAVDLGAGDTVLLMTDGFPELLNDAGQQLGYGAAREAFAAAASATCAADVIETIVSVARNWRGTLAPNDDITFVVVRVS
jgi:serine phosphatase RsbU (regulator of sigma subunit)